jgi:hypothetical protein
MCVGPSSVLEVNSFLGVFYIERVLMWQSIPGAGVLAVRDGHVLMVLHERDGICRWELPSGIVEHGESYQFAVSHCTMLACRDTFASNRI